MIHYGEIVRGQAAGHGLIIFKVGLDLNPLLAQVFPRKRLP